MTNRFMSKEGSIIKLNSFNNWLNNQKVKYRIIIPGNHDCIFEEIDQKTINQIFTNSTILINNFINVEGLIIFASPLSYGKSNNKSFQSENFIENSFSKSKEILLKTTIDILITHGSCKELVNIIKPKQLHVYGHYHAQHGARWKENNNNNNNNSYLTVCASVMDKNYNPNQLPFIIDISRPL